MKVKLELNLVGEHTFLNFWDSNSGDDVVAEVRNGELFYHQYTDGQNDAVETKISFQQFIDKVKEVVGEEES